MADSVDNILDQWSTARPDVDVSPMGILGRLSRLTRLLEREQHTVFSRHGLQPGEFDILATLLRADTVAIGLTAGQLAESAMVTSGAITNRLDRLLAKKLITRETDPHSRRTIRVALTPQGLELIDAALLDHVAHEKAMLSVMDSQQLSHLEDLLRVLLEHHEGLPRA